jgi:hypothetical protein
VSALGRWLVGILNAHIERDNVPVAEPAPDTPLARFYIGQLDELAAEPDEDDGPSLWSIWEANASRMFWGEQAVRATNRPCWACGDPAGFHVEHLPCWKVAPFRQIPREARRP